MPVKYIPFDEPPVAVVSPKSCPPFTDSFHLLFDCLRVLEYAKIRHGLFCSLLYVFTDVQLKTSKTRTSPLTGTKFSFPWSKFHRRNLPDISNSPLTLTKFSFPRSKFHWNLPRYLELPANSNCFSFPFRVQVTGVPLYFKRQALIWFVWNVDDIFVW